MNTSDFDRLDGSDGLGLGPDLTARLRAAAGAEPDLAAAHAVLGRRVAGARRRRAAAVTGSAGLSVLLLGALYVANTGDRGGRISSADAPAVASFGDDDSSTSVTATSVTVPSVTTLPPAPAITTDPSSSAVTSSSVGDDATESDRELFDVTAASTEVRTVSGIGGSVEVRVENGVLSFAGFPVAAQGFTAQVTRDEAGLLEVTFTSDTHLTRLRVRLDGARWRADRHEEATPSSSVPGAPNGTAPHTSTDDDGDDDSDDDSNSDSNSDSNDDADDSNDDANDDSKDDSNGSNSNDDSSNRGGSGSGGSGSGGSNGGSGSGGSGSGGSDD